jgi:hypothetical protein
MAPHLLVAFITRDATTTIGRIPAGPVDTDALVTGALLLPFTTTGTNRHVATTL